MRFNDAGVVITGAGGGIGAALTRRFLSEGARVYAADRDANKLAALQTECASCDNLRIAHFDVSDEAACAAFAQSVRHAWGRVDVLVNNAGYFPVCAFEDMTLAQWRDVCAINLDSVFIMSQRFLPLMKEGGHGRIVNIGSGSVFKGPAGQTHYVAAKAGVIGFTRALANAVGQYGITANVVTPGLTATPGALDVFSASALEARAKLRPIQRVQTAEDLVGVVMFLASRDADFITGQTLNVDGGVTMR